MLYTYASLDASAMVNTTYVVYFSRFEPALGWGRKGLVRYKWLCRTAAQITALRLRLAHAGMAALLCMMHACLMAVSASERCLYVLLEGRQKTRSAQNIQDHGQAVTSQPAL